jgi:hypothetical protein
VYKTNRVTVKDILEPDYSRQEELIDTYIDSTSNVDTGIGNIYGDTHVIMIYSNITYIVVLFKVSLIIRCTDGSSITNCIIELTDTRRHGKGVPGYNNVHSEDMLRVSHVIEKTMELMETGPSGKYYIESVDVVYNGAAEKAMSELKR